MINLLFGAFFITLDRLRIQIERAEARIREGSGNEEANFLDSVRDALSDLKGHCGNLDLIESRKYIDTISHRFTYQKTNTDIQNNLNSLRDIIQNEARDRHVYHFSAAKSYLFIEEPRRWNSVRDAFKAAQSDIDGALKCHAFGQDTACVFHCMRIAELGLRALTRERRVNRLKTRHWIFIAERWGSLRRLKMFIATM